MSTGPISLKLPNFNPDIMFPSHDQGGSFFSNFASPMSQLKGIGSIFSKGGLENIMSGLKLGSFKDIGPVDKGYRIFQKKCFR